MILVANMAFCQTNDLQPKRLDDDYGDSFLNYEPYVIKGKKKEQAKPDPSQSSPKPKPEQKVDVEWLKKNYPVLENRAIDNPTKENVEAFAYTKRVVLDKASRYQQAYMDLLRTDPWLNENNRVPFATAGARSVTSANYKAQRDAVKEMAKSGGAILFIDGKCRHCALQVPVIDMLRKQFDLDVLIVSTDGTKPTSISGEIQLDNGMFKRLGLSLRPSFVYIPKPKSFSSFDKDPNKYMIISQGFYALDEMIKQIAYAGFYTKILPENIMKDLDAWNTGIMSNEDLTTLTLDPNQPRSFKEKIAPLLMKKYEQYNQSESRD